MENKEIIGIAIGTIIFTALILICAVYFYKSYKKVQRDKQSEDLSQYKKKEMDEEMDEELVKNRQKLEDIIARVAQSQAQSKAQSDRKIVGYRKMQKAEVITTISPTLENFAASFIMDLHKLGIKQLKDGDKIINLNDINWTQQKGLPQIISAFGKDKIYELGRDLQIESIAFLVKNAAFCNLRADNLCDIFSMFIECATKSCCHPVSRSIFDGRATEQFDMAAQLVRDGCIDNARYKQKLSDAINLLPIYFPIHTSELGRYSDIFDDKGFCIIHHQNQNKRFISDGKTVKDNILEAFVKARKILQPFMNHPETASDMKYIYDCIGEEGSCIFASTKAKLQSMLDTFRKDLAIMEDNNFREYVLNDSNASNEDVVKFFDKIAYRGLLHSFDDFTKYKLNFSISSLRSLNDKLDHARADIDMMKKIVPEEILKTRYLLTIDCVGAMRADLTQLNDGFSKSSINFDSEDQRTVDGVDSSHDDLTNLNDEFCKSSTNVDSEGKLLDETKFKSFEKYKEFLQMCVREIPKMLSSNVIEQEKENLLIPKLKTTLKNISTIVDDWYVLGAVSGLYQYCAMPSEHYDRLLSFLGNNNTPSVNFDEPIDIDSLPDLFSNMLSSVDANDKDFSEFCSDSRKEIAKKIGSIQKDVLISRVNPKFRLYKKYIMASTNAIAEDEIDSVKPFSEYFFGMSDCEQSITEIGAQGEDIEEKAKSGPTLFGANLENVNVNVNGKWA